jgi:general secretion pathway protein G
MQFLEVQFPKLGSRISAAVGRKKREAGFTLVEVVVAFTILLILSTMAVPLARHQVRRQREKELLVDLREIRTAIDRYKDMCDAGKLQSTSQEAYCYPTTLESLVEGVPLSNTISGLNQKGKMRFLRRIPKDPMTGESDWGKRSMQDDPTSSSWGGQNVFDVYSKTMDKTADGTSYSEW